MSNMKNTKKDNLTTSEELVIDENSAYISEVQTFDEPVDYEVAFKKYYPKPDTEV
ncbi:MAG: hypothetical protein ACRDA5_04465 [Clostridium sp.]